MTESSERAGTADQEGWSGRRGLVVGITAGVLLIVLLVGAALVLFDDEPSRQQAVAERGAHVMPFDLEATTHVFDATGFGGIQTVVADDPDDDAQVALVRSHLREEVKRFRRGDFGDPATIHGDNMPGLGVLEARYDELEITYRAVATGAEVTYRSGAPAVVVALHDWFAAQLDDHGGHAEGG